MEAQINQDEVGRILRPNVEPAGIITDSDVAVDVVKKINPQVASPSSPKAELGDWKYIVDMFSPEMFTHIAKVSSFSDRKNCFKTLSIRFDEESPFTVEDLLNVSVGPTVEDNEDEYIKHILDAYEYALTVLPPVTATLVGGWLGQVRVFERDYYRDEVLPDSKRWGGLNYPYRREIQISMSCWNEYGMEYPASSHSSSCTMLHELGHVVHNIYGFYRPGDTGYVYPSSKNNRDSTGTLTPVNLSGHQKRFVYELFRSYSLHHRTEFDDIHHTGYCRTHPVESFACAFELLLRKGESEIFENYEQFKDVLSMMK